jgi:AAA ATPase domain
VWKFEAKHLGKVRSAEISRSKLVILVGRNNTGKSYVATLAWAISNINILLRKEGAEQRRPQWFAAFTATLDTQQTAEIRIDQAKADSLIAYLNNEFERNGSSFLQEIFAYDGFSGTTVRVSAETPFTPFLARIAKPEATEPGRIPVAIGTIAHVDGRPTYRVRIPLPARLKDPERRIGDRLFLELIRRTLFGMEERYQRRAVYIPAARTGLMLAFRALVAQLFEDPSTLSLPRPLVEFLRNLSFRSSVPPEQTALGTWLEKEVTFGSIDATEDEVPTFLYHPSNTNLALPLHAASSMITELAPFLLLMRDIPPGQIIFEEPEAHLHLSAQRSMARALARLMNSGVRVLVTTHSDTFMQQINNLMNLHSHPNRESLLAELGYDANDLIDPTEAKAYEFVAELDHTRVVELEKAAEGFIVPSLNDTLANLAQETISLHEDENDRIVSSSP